MNANETEIAEAIVQIKTCGGFSDVRRKITFEAVSETLAAKTVTLVTILAAPPGVTPRYIATATRPGDGKRAYSGKGDTLTAAIAGIEWSHFLA